MKDKIVFLGCFFLLFTIGYMGTYQDHNNFNNDLSKIVGADCGPCISIPFYECGVEGGAGSCVYQAGGWCGPAGGGTGVCGSDCPSNTNHQGCSGIFGSCTMGVVNCAEYIRPRCVYKAWDPTPCDCDNSCATSLGVFCPRADC